MEQKHTGYQSKYIRQGSCGIERQVELRISYK